MVPAKKPELTQRHKDARLAFSRAHARWNNPQRRRIMFFRRVQVLSTKNGGQKTSLAAGQRTA